MDRNINKWQKLNELRKIDPHICGGYYAKNFLKTHRLDFYSEGYIFFPEFVEVAKINGEIVCRLAEPDIPDEDTPFDSDECVFKTSVGIFVSHNHGEFDCDFQLVFNMLVSDGKMFLGADKAVVVFDLQTKEINAYMPLNVKAEKNIIGISR